MGLLSSIGKGIRGLFRGIGKVFKAVIRSPVGIAAVAAGVFLGGGALGLWETPFESINGAWASPAAEAASVASGSSLAEQTLAGGGGVDSLVGGGEDSFMQSGGLIGQSVAPTAPATIPGTPEFNATMGMSQAPVAAAEAPSAASSMLDTGGDILKNATNWLAKNPVPALIMGNMLSSAFTPNQIDVQNNAAQKQMELEDWRRQYAAQNTNVGLISTRMRPSGQPLRNITPNPAVPYPVK